MNSRSIYYHDLPRRAVSLRQFCKAARQLDYHNREDEFVQFVLTGVYDAGNGTLHQAVIDPLVNLPHQDEHMVLERDYDSFLGIVYDLPMDSSLTITPVPEAKGTLTKSVHITRDIG